VEISGYASAFARRHGCNVHNAPLDELDLGTEAFDVIVMWDVIEHFERPLHVIARCHSMLRPGGALTLKTPDARALDGPAGMLRRLYRQFVYPANTAEHYFHYTPNALQRVLATAGFSEFQVDERDEWEERVISGRNPVVRGVRYAIMRYAFSAAWPYEFVITAVKR
jgi:2-polyprenyl-3-methyl-5-hydroxy-6-metoxy-1,4-benzoquinol methylase